MSVVTPNMLLSVSNLLSLLFSKKNTKIHFFFGGLGDHVMCTAVFRELRIRTGVKALVVTNYPEVYENSPDVHVAHVGGRSLRRWLNFTGGSPVDLDYSCDPSELAGLRHHLIADIGKRAGLRGKWELSPIIYLRDEEKSAFTSYRNAIVLHSSGQGARYPIPTKEWNVEGLERVVSLLCSDYRVVQIGHENDPLLAGAEDLRGKTTIRQSAALLSNARLFVGTVGGLMHLARAVGCPSVIIYGGREKPEQSGYPENENIVSDIECSPCWLNDCPRNMLCMRGISVDEVMQRIGRALGNRSPLV